MSSRTMARLITLALAAYGIRVLWRSVAGRSGYPVLEEELRDWESEGGAVPVGSNRIAASIRPRLVEPSTEDLEPDA